MVNNMLKIRKEIWIMIIQFIVFLGAQIIVRLSGEMYGSLFVVLIIYPISVLVLSIAISWTKGKLKYLYPIYVAIIFLLIVFSMLIGFISNYIAEFFTKENGKKIK